MRDTADDDSLFHFNLPSALQMKANNDVFRSVPCLMLTLQFVYFKLSSACQMKIDSDVSRSVPFLMLTLSLSISNCPQPVR